MKSIYEQVMWYMDRYFFPAVLWTGAIYIAIHVIVAKLLGNI